MKHRVKKERDDQLTCTCGNWAMTRGNNEEKHRQFGLHVDSYALGRHFTVADAERRALDAAEAYLEHELRSVFHRSLTLAASSAPHFIALTTTGTIAYVVDFQPTWDHDSNLDLVIEDAARLIQAAGQTVGEITVVELVVSGVETGKIEVLAQPLLIKEAVDA